MIVIRSDNPYGKNRAQECILFSVNLFISQKILETPMKRVNVPVVSPCIRYGVKLNSVHQGV